MFSFWQISGIVLLLGRSRFRLRTEKGQKMTNQAIIAATDTAAAAAFDMLNAARRHEADTFRAWMADKSRCNTPIHEAYLGAVRAADIAKAAYEAVREAGEVLRAAVA